MSLDNHDGVGALRGFLLLVAGMGALNGCALIGLGRDRSPQLERLELRALDSSCRKRLPLEVDATLHDGDAVPTPVVFTTYEIKALHLLPGRDGTSRAYLTVLLDGDKQVGPRLIRTAARNSLLRRIKLPMSSNEGGQPTTKEDLLAPRELKIKLCATRDKHCREYTWALNPIDYEVFPQKLTKAPVDVTIQRDDNSLVGLTPAYKEAIDCIERTAAFYVDEKAIGYKRSAYDPAFKLELNKYHICGSDGLDMGVGNHPRLRVAPIESGLVDHSIPPPCRLTSNFTKQGRSKQAGRLSFADGRACGWRMRLKDAGGARVLKNKRESVKLESKCDGQTRKVDLLLETDRIQCNRRLVLREQVTIPKCTNEPMCYDRAYTVWPKWVGDQEARQWLQDGQTVDKILGSRPQNQIGIPKDQLSKFGFRLQAGVEGKCTFRYQVSNGSWVPITKVNGRPGEGFHKDHSPLSADCRAGRRTHFKIAVFEGARLASKARAIRPPCPGAPLIKPGRDRGGHPVHGP